MNSPDKLLHFVQTFPMIKGLAGARFPAIAFGMMCSREKSLAGLVRAQYRHKRLSEFIVSFFLPEAFMLMGSYKAVGIMETDVTEFQAS